MSDTKDGEKVKFVRLPNGDGYLDNGRECLLDDRITDPEAGDGRGTKCHDILDHPTF